MSKRDHILVGLDIGTTKICAIVAEVPEEGPLNIIGVGSCPSRGPRHGAASEGGGGQYREHGGVDQEGG